MLDRLAGLMGRAGMSAMAIPFSLLLALLMLVMSEVAYREADDGWSRVSDRIQARLTMVQMLQHLSEAESGKRGFLLVGGDEYLRPYTSAHGEVQTKLAQLQALYEKLEDAESEVHRQKIGDLVRAKLGEMDEVLRLQREGRPEAALDVVRSGIGRDMMDQLMKAGEAFIAYQNMRIAGRMQSIANTLLLNRIGVATLTALALLTLVMIVRQGRAMEAQRLQRQNEMQAERDRLEAEVQRRTAELTELARHLQTAREDERAHLARELHDELGALLTAAKLDVARIRPKLQQDLPDLMPRLTHLTETLNHGIALKRRIIEDLRPSTLNSLGLVPALEILCKEFADRSGLAVKADLSAVRMAPSAELTVFRLVQEALTNIAKYAQASEVNVRLASGPDGAEVAVRDNGVGFDGKAGRGSHGLVGMRFRVEAEKGRLDLQTRPGAGTTIRAWLPDLPAT